MRCNNLSLLTKRISELENLEYGWLNHNEGELLPKEGLKWLLDIVYI